MVKAQESFAFVATQNPIETSGTYRLSKVLVDRIGCWIRLTYPTKETELEILKENTPAISLPVSALDKIYEIVKATRESPVLEIPASPRSGIYLTRLVNKYIDRFETEDAAIRFFPTVRLAFRIVSVSSSRLAERWTAMRFKSRAGVPSSEPLSSSVGRRVTPSESEARTF